MTAQPIIEAEDVLVTAVRDALMPYAGEMSDGRPKVFYELADQDADRPLIVFFFQADVNRLDYVSHTAATTLLTVKANADSREAAWQLRSTFSPGLDHLTYPGYTIQARYDSTPRLPPTPSGIYQAAHIWRVTIERI